ncbi:exodeoxyribonuclease V subunit alpha [Rodentibacter caecimuris]|uniref:RecBCD enzyme subunit RecD n=1 Tax=Rodentibacter caecimuris TaxID=1796644 RepID=A0ABX3KYC8_9PAST|nr:exodeoxyribonuclease V subunit alpha [Rodentibacter heylii]
MLALLDELKQKQIISSADFYFAKLIGEKQENQPEAIKNLAMLLAVLCNQSVQQGNICLVLNDNILQQFFYSGLCQFEKDYIALIKQKIGDYPVYQWQSLLQDNVAFTEYPQQKVAPLVFQFNALYFYRYWKDERIIALYLKSAVKNQRVLLASNVEIAKALDRYFFTSGNKVDIDWQKIAAAVALSQQFSIISGGPGTGKTTTVAKLLAALQTLSQGQLHIKLVAPTGKAAARLTESLNNSLQKLKQEKLLSNELVDRIPTSAQTIHRLLGVRPFSDKVIYDVNNPLQIDLLVVDEASMIDLTLMAKLMQALRPDTRLILLGDKDQLSAVEAGAVLAELLSFHQAETPYSPAQTQYLKEVTGYQLVESIKVNRLQDSVASLKFSYRAKEAPYILRLAEKINEGKGWESREEFNGNNSLIWHELSGRSNLTEILCLAVEKYQQYLLLILHQLGRNNNEQLSEIFQAFNSCRFLTALRIGEFGVENLNQKIAESLRRQALVKFKSSQDWYLGKPIMITQNDDTVKLYNGDIGLYLGDGTVYFEQGEGQYRAVPTSRIPSYEPAFAMTVHKSQGSEFEHTVLVLPVEFNPILSRELVYTAITRAKKTLTVFANSRVWDHSLNQMTQRQSSLRYLLNEE